LEKILKVKIELKAKQLYDLFIDYFKDNCRSIYPAAHLKEEITLLDSNYQSEPTFAYKLTFEVEFTKDAPKMLGTVHSIRRACDNPDYNIAEMNERLVEGILSCTFRSHIQLQSFESEEYIGGMFATEVFSKFNIVHV
jgi:hypothetical protein